MKDRCAVDLHNGIVNYYLELVNRIYDKKLPANFKVENILYALMSVLSFDLAFNKEKMVGKGNKDYVSMMSDNNIDNMLDLLNEPGNDPKLLSVIKSGTSLFANIRNKLSHGDYHIDDKCFVFEYKHSPVPNDPTFDVYYNVRINILKFVTQYLELTDALEARLKGDKFTKYYLENRGGLVVNKPLETEQEINNFTSLLKIKKYTLRRLDGKSMHSFEKELFEKEIFELEKKSSVIGNSKQLDRDLQEKYSKLGYVLVVENLKIKDSNLVGDVKNVIKSNNMIALKQIPEDKIYDDEEKTKYSTAFLNVLTQAYGESINKLLPIDEINSDILIGNRLNLVLLSNMYINKSVDFNDIISKFDLELKSIFFSSFNEIFSSILLSRFYALYCYPLDDIYNKGNVYDLNRDGYFDYEKLDLSELNPNILIMTRPELVNINNNIRELKKEKDELERKINSKNSKINSILKCKVLTDTLKSKIEKFNEEIKVEQEKINDIDDSILQRLEYFDQVDKDYTENEEYFRKRAIIEGIRNSVLHGNVMIVNPDEMLDVTRIKLRFTNIYQKQLMFQMTASIYEMESLFEEVNVSVINNYRNGENNKVLKK